MQGKERGRGEKPISPRYTNLPESAHVAFDVSRNTQILSREPVRPTKPKEDKPFGRIEFVITRQRLLENLVQVAVTQWKTSNSRSFFGHKTKFLNIHSGLRVLFFKAQFSPLFVK